MRELKVYIEIQGNMRYAGIIKGESFRDAVFSYDKEYVSSSYGAPISISLPFGEEFFDVDKTKHFYESLLPEGFSRRAVAEWIKTDENDYLTILSVLGRECLGAIKIVEGEDDAPGHYVKLSKKQVKELAAEGATRSTKILMETHLSLTGASGKVGLFYDDKKDSWYLPKGDAPSTHIVKQSHVRLKQIVLNEQLSMLTAKKMGIDVPESFIINIGSGKDEDVLLATKRYDRISDKGRVIDGFCAPIRLHQEDFAQALNIPSDKKYEKTLSGYMRKMFELLRSHSSNPIEDQRKLSERIIFNYLIGNTDSHIKNFALLYDKDLRSIRLAPAYDIVAARVYDTTSEMSFYIADKLNIDEISRESFIMAADEIGVGRRFMEKAFDDSLEKFEKALDEATREIIEQGFKNAKKLSDKIKKTGGYERCV
ncbi:MAG: HipA domain-containing protein [Lachnospiraceae bacterium]|nr:HipA domain-containing protein [Lachnospiraceae bacterium]